ncbi:MAG: hypothetical protein IKA88_01980 [Clostridia bacterium]|nr:hypothetical protein [Clostridia bacterium]
MLNTLLGIFKNLDPMNKDSLMTSLEILWKGLLAIFIVIGLIIVTVKIVDFVIHKAEEYKKAREAEKDALPDQTQKQ